MLGSPALRRRILLLSALTAALGLAECRSPLASAPRGRQRSLLIVTLDTTRRDFISPYGADPRLTPNLTRLASEGALFLDAYSALNVTNPSHVSIMSGLAARDHGVFDNYTALDPRIDTLAEAFRRKGYTTAAFPAIPHVWKVVGWRGFDHLAETERELSAAEVTDRAIDWLRQAGTSAPSFVWLHYYDAHAPYRPPRAALDMFYRGDPTATSGPLLRSLVYAKERKAAGGGRWLGEARDPAYARALYAGEIHTVDRELGRVLGFLDESGRAARTVVCVVADHGESLGEHGIYYSHAGLFEPEVRIPLIVRVPGFPAGLEVAMRVSQLDLAPTFAGLFGIRLRNALPGRSLEPYLAGELVPGSPRGDHFFVESAHNLEVVARDRDWKLIWPVARTEGLPSEPLLFDLASDPDELTNLYDEHTVALRALVREIAPWRRLGRVRRGADVDAEQAKRLRALGYVD